MTITELEEYLQYEAELSPSTIQQLDKSQLVEQWLEYNGIINYTNDILDVVEAAYNVKLPH